MSTSVKKHLLILLLATVFARGLVFISYPVTLENDSEAVSHYMVNEVLHGNLLIGNLRYNSGYAFVMAPIVALANIFGSQSTRIIIIAQSILAGLIPFLVYDILRRRRSPKEALIVALIATLDPFALEWSHFFLPVCLTALCTVLAIWLIQRAQSTTSRKLLWIAAAGLCMGTAILVRWELVVVAATMGVALLFLPVSWFMRIKNIVGFGVAGGGLVVVYFILVQYPSTKTWSTSCISGADLLYSDGGKVFPLLASDGPATVQYLKLVTLKPLRDLTYAGPEYYANWQKPGPWVSSQEAVNFAAQPYGTPEDHVTVGLPATLWYYMGPCLTDSFLRAVHTEAVNARPITWLTATAAVAGQILVQIPDNHVDAPNNMNDLYLPHYDVLQFDTSNARLGFARAFDANDYYYSSASPALVWMPGVWLYSILFDLLNTAKYLAPFALVWAIWTRDWFYRTSAISLIVFIGLISVVNVSQPRIFAEIYPITDILIGGFVVFAVQKFQGWLKKL